VNYHLISRFRDFRVAPNASGMPDCNRNPTFNCSFHISQDSLLKREPVEKMVSNSLVPLFGGVTKNPSAHRKRRQRHKLDPAIQTWPPHHSPLHRSPNPPLDTKNRTARCPARALPVWSPESCSQRQETAWARRIHPDSGLHRRCRVSGAG
jgi:hypothetical protein